MGPLPEGDIERAIVRAVARLARDLSLDCTAEGIETAQQQEFLADLASGARATRSRGRCPRTSAGP